VINGTNIVEDVLTKYKAAWAEKGMISENGLFRRWYAVKRATVLDTDEIAHSAWYVIQILNIILLLICCFLSG
jgi:hypothetical protein